MRALVFTVGGFFIVAIGVLIQLQSPGAGGITIVLGLAITAVAHMVRRDSDTPDAIRRASRKFGTILMVLGVLGAIVVSVLGVPIFVFGLILAIGGAIIDRLDAIRIERALQCELARRQERERAPPPLPR